MRRDDNLKAGDVIIDSTGDWVVLISREEGENGCEDLWARLSSPSPRLWKFSSSDPIFYNEDTRIATGINLYDTFTKLKQEVE